MISLDRPTTAPTRNRGNLSHFLKPGSLSSTNHSSFRATEIGNRRISVATISSSKSSLKLRRNFLDENPPPVDIAANQIDITSIEFLEHWQGESSFIRLVNKIEEPEPEIESELISTELIIEPPKHRHRHRHKHRNKTEKIQSENSVEVDDKVEVPINSNDTDINNSNEEHKLIKELREKIRRSSYDIMNRKMQRIVISSSTSDPIESKPIAVDSLNILHSITHKPKDILMQKTIFNHQIPFTIRNFMPHSNNNNDNDNDKPLTVIDVHDMGLGDEKGLCLAGTLSACPDVTTVNISGNRLTDKSVQPILEQLLKYVHCTSLDLSANKMDSLSIQMLNESLKDRSCSLQKLILKQSDIDDNECAELMEAMSVNRSVTALDLTGNLIGEMEEYNTVRPDFITGGEAIASMLALNPSLRELNLKDSALTLVQSMSTNNNLLILKIAHNNIGDSAAQALGHALRENVSLTELDVSFNHLEPKSAIVFAHALQSNEFICELNMSGSCIGELGARALLRTIRHNASQGRLLKIGLDNTNIHYKDSSIFCRSNPAGSYELQLSDPYDYTVAHTLLELANTKPLANILDFKYQPAKSRPWESMTLCRLRESKSDRDRDRGASKSFSNGRDRDRDSAMNESWKPVIEELNKSIEEVCRVSKLTRRTLVEVEVHQAGAKCDKAIHKFCKKLNCNPKNNVIKYLKVFKYGASISSLSSSSPSNRDKTYPFQNNNNNNNNTTTTANSVASVASTNTTSNDIDRRTAAAAAMTSSISSVSSKSSQQHSQGKSQSPSHSRSKGSGGGSGGNTMDEMDLACVLEMIGKNLFLVEGAIAVEIETDPNEKYSMQAKKIIASMDVKTQGFIHEEEFIRYILTSLTSLYPESPSVLIDQSTRKLFVYGRVRFRFEMTPMQTTEEELLGMRALSLFSESLEATAKSELLYREMLLLAISDEDFAMDCETAEDVIMFLPRIATRRDAMRFVTQSLHIDELIRLREITPSLFKASMGLASGHYSLDLNKQEDVLIGRRIAELNAFELFEGLRYPSCN
eukprot:gene5786-11688_t